MNEVQLCLSEMRTFFNSGTTLEVSWRKEQLKILKSTIKAYESAILAALYEDLGKSGFEGYATELSVIYAELNSHIRNLEKWTKKRRVPSTILSFPSHAYTIAQPVGVVLIMSPWNYPFQLAITPLVSAIAAGNCAIVKPSRYSSHTSLVIEELLAKAFQSHYVATFQGGASMNQELLSHRFDHIFFTGSTAIGKLVMSTAAQTLTPVTLELGGKSPVIVEADSDLELAAKRIAWGKCLNAGQTCVAPDYVLVERKALPVLLEALKSAIDKMYGSDPINNDEYPKIINEKHFSRLLTYFEQGTLRYGGAIDPRTSKIAPTILTDVKLDSPLMTEEIFGPLLPLVPYDNIEEAIQFIQGREHPLALYIFSRNKKHHEHITKRLIYGGGCINDTIMHLSNPHLQFGGVGHSGLGQYHAKAGFDTFSHTKSILVREPWPDIPFRYAPFKGKLPLIRRFF